MFALETAAGQTTSFGHDKSGLVSSATSAGAALRLANCRNFVIFSTIFHPWLKKTVEKSSELNERKVSQTGNQFRRHQG
jgi:hypothetical protein